jgi:preprotein translocase subunit SecA
VLVGTTSVEISELLSRMLKIRNIKHNVLNAKLHQKEAEIVAEAGKAGTVTIATNMAGRGTDIKLGPGVREAGGLAIIGTERHDSRRVDRQLRGRAGRQGDPGSSRFFVSLEDDLMRLFGSDRIARMMDRMGHKEGDVLESSMITNAIERAQKKVEENNFGIRKRLIEYDDVMNAQRDVIYTKRKHALFGERLSIDISNTMSDVVSVIVNEYHDAKDYEAFKLELIRIFSIDAPLSEEEFFQKPVDEISQSVFEAVTQTYKHKNEFIAQRSYPVIREIYEREGNKFENIVIPFTDGIKNLQLLVNMKRAYDSQGKDVVTEFEKGVILAMIDDAWKEHLREMDDLKQSVQNAVYEQKDPLLIYKFESFNLFNTMLTGTNKEIVSFLMKGSLPNEGQQQNVRQAPAQQKQDLSKLKTQRSEVPQSNGNPNQQQANMNTQEQVKQQPVKAEVKVGRNDPCPCGSGKKYKNCHGA